MVELDDNELNCPVCTHYRDFWCGDHTVKCCELDVCQFERSQIHNQGDHNEKSL